MRCLYINLDDATDRRAALEVNFQNVRADGWSLTRVPAVDVAQVRQTGVAGTIRETEKACFLSHKKALRESLGDDGHVMVLEDDVLLGAKTCGTMERLIEEAKSRTEWDIIYGEVGITRIVGMVELLAMRRRLAAERATMFLDLKPFWYAGATAYIVNRKSKEKLLRFAEAETALDQPYDLFLRRYVRKDALRAYVAFPFATTLAPIADASIQRTEEERRTEQLWLTFRRMIWAEGSVEEQLPALERLASTIGIEARAYGTLWACMVDPSYNAR